MKGATATRRAPHPKNAPISMDTQNAKKIILPVYNAEGEKVSERELPSELFGLAVKKGLLHLATVAQAASSRVVRSATKTRGEVRGGGKKPWKQKGTGRARHGSIRSPIWRGGGIVWGPRPERTFAVKLNRKVKRTAIAMALSQKAHDGAIVLVEQMPQSGKTKDTAAFLAKLPIAMDAKKKPTIGVISPLGAHASNRSLRNIPNVSIVPAHSLNIIDVLRSKALVMPLESISQIEQRYQKA